MIETPIFSNYYIDSTKLYTNSFMSGRVFNSSLFLDIGSKLKSDPFQLNFLNDILYNIKDESNILALKVTEDLGKFTVFNCDFRWKNLWLGL